MPFGLRISTIAAVLGLAVASTSSLGQTFPSKPIKLVLPYTPGGVVDFIGRTLAQNLPSDVLGQPVVADNRPGAGGMVGTDVVARSPADGYTLLLMDPAIVINPTLQDSVPYDLFKQLEAISVVSSSPLVLVVSPRPEREDLRRIHRLRKGQSRQDELRFRRHWHNAASIGRDAEANYRHPGNAYPLQGYWGLLYQHDGEQDSRSSFSSIAGALPFTSDNRVVAIATTGDKPNPVYPDKPTVADAGIKGFVVDLWLTVFAPSGLPADVKAKLNQAIATALAKPQLKEAFAKVGASPRGTTAAEAGAFVKADSRNGERS